MTANELDVVETTWKNLLYKELKKLRTQTQDVNIQMAIDFVVTTVVCQLCHEKIEVLCED